MRPSRYLFALGTIFVVLFGIVIGFGSGSLGDRLHPRLGLDLVGGSTMTLVATTLDGSPPSAENLEQARQIIENRVNGFGVAEAEVVTEGNDHIVISAPGNDDTVIRNVGQPAQLRFRKVINTTNDDPGTVTPSATPSASASGSPSATASPKPSATATPKPTATATPSATANPSGSATATPNPSASASADRIAKLRESVLKKLGGAAAVSAQLQGPADKATDPTTYAQLEVFRELTPDEVSVLPANIQFNVPQVTCDILNKRTPGSIDDPAVEAVACEDTGNTKFLLDKAQVQGTDIDTANAQLSQQGGGWVVNLIFNGEGAEKWTALTREAYNNDESLPNKCIATQPDRTGAKQVCMVAVVLDNEVVTAPSINEVLSTQSEISGGFTKESASLLAQQLKFGALPLSFVPGNVFNISATLGTEYLQAGLLAAGVGMLLVIVYAFFYYRLLGLVITLSLLLSALLTFGMLVLLGRSIGFTLTLAGIAGFIVSLGVAADSFVIYFERLKDEIREGRSPRSAVPRAWLRARRTIITANAVTFLAALVLWIVGVGSVKGFAFALGLATLLDLIIVFLFRHPMMTLLARTPAFLSPRVSGLGRVLHHATEDTPTTGSRSARPKEA